MPEATRRAIYGTEDVPVAKPRTEPGKSEEGREPLVVARRQEFEVPAAQPRRAMPPPVAPHPVRPQPVRPSQPSRHAAPPSRPQPAPGPAPLRPVEQRRLAPETQPRPAPQETSHPQRRQPQRRRQAPPPVLQPEPEGPRTPARAAFQAAPPMQHAHRGTGRRHRLFANMDEVRRGIILREILGPPKAFE